MRISQRENGCPGPFYRQSVTSIFAGCRSWKLARVRSAGPAEGRAAGQSNTRFTGAATQIFVNAGKPSKPAYLDVKARALRFIPQ